MLEGPEKGGQQAEPGCGDLAELPFPGRDNGGGDNCGGSLGRYGNQLFGEMVRVEDKLREKKGQGQSWGHSWC